MKANKVDIIGGGIGGLTTAIALQKKGVQLRVFEQAKALKAVGAGIILANNAMQVYERLGLRKELEASGNPISTMKITRSNLKPISKVDLSYFEKKYKAKNTAIHRGRLHEILVNHLQDDALKLDHTLEDIVRDGAAFNLKFNNNKNIHSDLVIAADGIDSVVRKSLFPENRIRFARQVCWRGLGNIKLPQQYQHELNEAWGKGDRFGFVYLEPGLVYWYALKSYQEDLSEYDINELDTYFEDYHPLIKDIINSTDKTRIHTAEMSDLAPTKTWHANNVCLIGDAAHATTPNMGQGACQAIEDAYTLAGCMAKYEPNQAFAVFQNTRLPKAHQVVNTSWTLGKIAHMSHPFFIGLRNQLMQWTPQWVSRKQTDQVFQLAAV